MRFKFYILSLFCPPFFFINCSQSAPKLYGNHYYVATAANKMSHDFGNLFLTIAKKQLLDTNVLKVAKEPFLKTTKGNMIIYFELDSRPLKAI